MVAADYRQMGRQALTGHWGKAILVSLIVGAVNGGISSGVGSNSMVTWTKELSTGELQEVFDAVKGFHIPGWFWGVAGGALVGATLAAAALAVALAIVGGVLALGNADFYTRLAGGTDPAFTRLFAYFKMLWKAFGLRMLTALYVFLWSLLFIVPGIIAAYRYALAPYLMAEHPEMGIVQAMDESKGLMDGHKGRLFCLRLSFIGWGLLAVLSCGVGFIWLTPYISASEAAFYLDRTGRIRAEAA